MKRKLLWRPHALYCHAFNNLFSPAFLVVSTSQHDKPRTKQEIRQAIIKRNALLPGASKKRLAAKKAKADMLKRSSERSQGGSSDRDGAPEDEFELNATDVLDHDAKGQGAGPRIAASG